MVVFEFVNGRSKNWDYTYRNGRDENPIESQNLLNQSFASRVPVNGITI